MSSPDRGIVAIIQARMGSTRLPGKTLADLAGRPLLGRILERVRASRRIGRICVATTVEPRDLPIVEFARAEGAEAHCGSVHDVLERFQGAAARCEARVVVRITADDPFKDPDVIDLVVDRLLGEPGLDYASNTLEPTFPEGLDVEVFRREALDRAAVEATLPSEREHVTPYIWKHPDRFRIAQVRHSRDLSALRWTLDYEEDLEFARRVYERLGGQGLFRMQAILDLLGREPELAAINTGFVRNAGYLKSLSQEQSSSQP